MIYAEMRVTDDANDTIVVEVEMTGYNVTGLLVNGGEPPEDLKCSVCDLLLKDALQLRDGRRVCSSCFKNEDQQR